MSELPPLIPGKNKSTSIGSIVPILREVLQTELAKCEPDESIAKNLMKTHFKLESEYKLSGHIGYSIHKNFEDEAQMETSFRDKVQLFKMNRAKRLVRDMKLGKRQGLDALMLHRHPLHQDLDENLDENILLTTEDLLPPPYLRTADECFSPGHKARMKSHLKSDSEDSMHPDSSYIIKNISLPRVDSFKSFVIDFEAIPAKRVRPRKGRILGKIKIFKLEPDLIAFKNFEPKNIYKSLCTLTNVSGKVGRFMLNPPLLESPFQISMDHLPGHTRLVASGMNFLLYITFRPMLLDDVEEEIKIKVFNGQDEKLVLRAYREPPLLKCVLLYDKIDYDYEDTLYTSDTIELNELMNDSIDLGQTLIGNINKTAMLCFNDGGKGTFFIMTENSWFNCNIDNITYTGVLEASYFKLYPVCFRIDPGCIIEMFIEFAPKSSPGLHVERFAIVCDCGVVRYFHAMGDAFMFEPGLINTKLPDKIYDIDLEGDRFSKYFLDLGKIYSSESPSKTFIIENRSCVPYDFFFVKRRCIIPEKIVMPCLDCADVGLEYCQCEQCKYSWDESSIDPEDLDPELLKITESKGILRSRHATRVTVELENFTHPCGVYRAVIGLVIPHVPEESIADGLNVRYFQPAGFTDDDSDHKSYSTEFEANRKDILLCEIEVWIEVEPIQVYIEPCIIDLRCDMILYNTMIDWVGVRVYNTGVGGTARCKWKSRELRPSLVAFPSEQEFVVLPADSLYISMPIRVEALSSVKETYVLTINEGAAEVSMMVRVHGKPPCITGVPMVPAYPAPGSQTTNLNCHPYKLGFLKKNDKHEVVIAIQNNSENMVKWSATSYDYRPKPAEESQQVLAGGEFSTPQKATSVTSRFHKSDGILFTFASDNVIYSIPTDRPCRFFSLIVIKTDACPDCDSIIIPVTALILDPDTSIEAPPSPSGPLLIPDGALYVGIEREFQINVRNRSPFPVTYLWGRPFGENADALTITISPSRGILMANSCQVAKVRLTGTRRTLIRGLHVPCCVGRAPRPKLLTIRCVIDTLRVAFLLPPHPWTPHSQMPELIHRPKEHCGECARISCHWCPCHKRGFNESNIMGDIRRCIRIPWSRLANIPDDDTDVYYSAMAREFTDDPNEVPLAAVRSALLFYHNLPDEWKPAELVEVSNAGRSETIGNYSTQSVDQEVSSPDNIETIQPATVENKVVQVLPQPQSRLRGLPLEAVSTVQFRKVPLRTRVRQSVIVHNETDIPTSMHVYVSLYPRENTPNTPIKLLNDFQSKHDPWEAECGNRGVVVECSPITSALLPNSFIQVNITVYANTWGIYNDDIVVEIETMKPFYLPLWIEVIGLPVSIPALRGQKNPTIRFGELSPFECPIRRTLKVCNDSAALLVITCHTYDSTLYGEDFEEYSNLDKPFSVILQMLDPRLVHAVPPAESCHFTMSTSTSTSTSNKKVGPLPLESKRKQRTIDDESNPLNRATFESFVERISVSATKVSKRGSKQRTSFDLTERQDPPPTSTSAESTSNRECLSSSGTATFGSSHEAVAFRDQSYDAAEALLSCQQIDEQMREQTDNFGADTTFKFVLVPHLGNETSILFNVKPMQLVLEPHSECNVQVSLDPRKFELSLDPMQVQGKLVFLARQATQQRIQSRRPCCSPLVVDLVGELQVPRLKACVPKQPRVFKIAAITIINSPNQIIRMIKEVSFTNPWRVPMKALVWAEAPFGVVCLKGVACSSNARSPNKKLKHYDLAMSEETACHIDAPAEGVVSVDVECRVETFQCYPPPTVPDCICTFVNKELHIYQKPEGLRQSLPLRLELTFPLVNVSPKYIKFGYVFIGDTARYNFTVINTGAIPLQFEVIFEKGAPEIKVWPMDGALNPSHVPTEFCVQFTPAKSDVLIDEVVSVTTRLPGRLARLPLTGIGTNNEKFRMTGYNAAFDPDVETMPFLQPDIYCI